MKIGVSILIVIVVIALGYYLLTRPAADDVDMVNDTDTTDVMDEENTGSTNSGNDEVAAETNSIVGSYRAERDEDFVADFRADGTVRFHNDAGSGTIENGSWYVMTQAQLDAVAFAVPEEQYAGKTVVAITFEDATYYTVEEDTDTTLVLNEIDGVEAFTFTRLEE